MLIIYYAHLICYEVMDGNINFNVDLLLSSFKISLETFLKQIRNIVLFWNDFPEISKENLAFHYKS